MNRLLVPDHSGNDASRVVGELASTANVLRDDRRPDAVAADVYSIDWDFEDSPRGNGVHGIYGYPAKFIPEIPRALITVLSQPGDVILDPFCGGGTAGVEALACDRAFMGLDANAFAVLLTRVKLQAVGRDSLEALKLHAGDVRRRRPRVRHGWAPEIPHIDKWYLPEVFADLVSLRTMIMAVEDVKARDVALLAFASTAARLSHQESETRYVSRPKVQPSDSVRSVYLKELDRIIPRLRRGQGSMSFKAEIGDARLESSYAAFGSSEVDAVVTSPPYPNAYDYHLYHRFRLFWLGEGPHRLRKVEIGSHLKNQARSNPTGDYLEDMRSMFTVVNEMLRPGGYFALVVGDGIHKGETFATASQLAAVAAELGYIKIACVSRRLPALRRSVTQPGRRLAEEQVLVLRSGKVVGHAN